MAMSEELLGTLPPLSKEQGDHPFAIVLSLCEQHLLQRDAVPASEPRVTMLTTLRDFGWHQAHLCGETEVLALVHATYASQMIDEAQPHLWGSEQQPWLERLDREYANIRVALDWAIPNAPALGLRMVSKLFRYWRIHNMLSEGRHYLTWALAAIPPDDIDMYAKALNGAGLLALQQGDCAQAIIWLTECLTYQRQIGEPRGLGGALTNLGLVFKEQGQYEEAQRCHQEALGVYQKAGLERDVAVALNNLGNIRRIQGDYAGAAQFQEESLAIHRHRGDTYAIALVLGNLGVLAQSQGHYDEAAHYFEETLALHQTLDNHFEEAVTLLNLGENAQLQGRYAQAHAWLSRSIAYFRSSGNLPTLASGMTLLGNGYALQGDWVAARAAYEEGLKLFAELHFPQCTYQCLLGFTQLFVHEGKLDQAVLWLGMLDQWCTQNHVILDARDQQLRAEMVGVTQAALPSVLWHAGWERGTSQPLDEFLHLME